MEGVVTAIASWLSVGIVLVRAKTWLGSCAQTIPLVCKAGTAKDDLKMYVISLIKLIIRIKISVMKSAINTNPSS